MSQHPTSAAAYEEVERLGILAKLQLATYRALLEHGPLTDHEIAAKIGKPRDTASPRVRELIRLGCVRVAGERKCTVTGFNCRTVELTGAMPTRQPSTFKTCTTARMPRGVLMEVLKGVDAVLGCVLLDTQQRAAGNRARRILSEHL